MRHESDTRLRRFIQIRTAVDAVNAVNFHRLGRHFDARRRTSARRHFCLPEAKREKLIGDLSRIFTNTTYSAHVLFSSSNQRKRPPAWIKYMKLCRRSSTEIVGAPHCRRFVDCLTGDPCTQYRCRCIINGVSVVNSALLYFSLMLL